MDASTSAIVVPGQTAYFTGEYGKAPALLTGTGGFYGGVQRQNIGLKRNAFDDDNNVGDFFDDSLIHLMVPTTWSITCPPLMATAEALNANWLAWAALRYRCCVAQSRLTRPWRGLFL